MLTIVVPARELYNEDTNEFINIPQTTLKLEHSLVSISKWEAKYKKPFISKTKDTKTREETIDYVRFMTLTQNGDPNVYYALTEENIRATAQFLAALPMKPEMVNLLVYHDVGKGKHARLGTTYNPEGFRMSTPSEDVQQYVVHILQEHGLNAKIGG